MDIVIIKLPMRIGLGSHARTTFDRYRGKLLSIVRKIIDIKDSFHAFTGRKSEGMRPGSGVERILLAIDDNIAVAQERIGVKIDFYRMVGLVDEVDVQKSGNSGAMDLIINVEIHAGNRTSGKGG